MDGARKIFKEHGACKDYINIKGEGLHMGFYRTPAESSEYYLPKEEYLTAIHYALRYPYLLAELNTVANADTSQAIQYDKPRVKSSGAYDPVSSTAIKRDEIREKIEKIEKALDFATKDDAEKKYLIMGVCHGANYWQLDRAGIPCGKARYYKIRRVFYYTLSKLI